MCKNISLYGILLSSSVRPHFCGSGWSGASLTLLVGRQEGHPAYKNWAVGCWRGYLSGARCRLASLPSRFHCHSLSLASVKSRLVLPFWYQLTRVVPDKELLNGCVGGAAQFCASTPGAESSSYASASVTTPVSAAQIRGWNVIWVESFATRAAGWSPLRVHTSAPPGYS